MKTLLMNIVLMALWIASTGDLGYGNILVGFVLSYLVLWWTSPLFGRTLYFKKLPMAMAFSVVILWEIIKANLRVAWDVVTPTRYRRPGIVAIPLDAETDLEIAVLANLVTLTPGSLCVDIAEDRRTMYIHAMFVDDPDSVRSEIKGRLECWVLALLR